MCLCYKLYSIKFSLSLVSSKSSWFTQCSATPYIHYNNIYMDKVLVYCLDPLNFRGLYPCIITSALLRDLQKVAASKPITWSFKIETTLISLNNNFGTLLTLVLGCFPFDIQPFRTMSDYLKFIFGTSENKYSLIESSRPPKFHKTPKLLLWLL